MKRRILLKTLAAGMVPGVAAAWLGLAGRDPVGPARPVTGAGTEGLLPGHDPEGQTRRPGSLADKVRDFDRDYADDCRLPKAQWPVLVCTLARMKGVRQLVGHANFSLLGFDAMLRYARNYPVIGPFRPAECAFLEEMFATDARRYGFLGDKVLPSLTSHIDRKAVSKVPHSGNYLFQGESLRMYARLRKDVGSELILTSGIRSVVKQLFLFLAKVEATAGNLSRASRSLAPPGHSYHGIGDFDVGRADLGAANFTARFARTPEFHKLRSLDYVAIRYTPDNRVGVRFEPWHIKVV